MFASWVVVSFILHLVIMIVTIFSLLGFFFRLSMLTSPLFCCIMISKQQIVLCCEQHSVSLFCRRRRCCYCYRHYCGCRCMIVLEKHELLLFRYDFFLFSVRIETNTNEHEPCAIATTYFFLSFFSIELLFAVRNSSGSVFRFLSSVCAKLDEYDDVMCALLSLQIELFPLLYAKRAWR